MPDIQAVPDPRRTWQFDPPQDLHQAVEQEIDRLQEYAKQDGSGRQPLSAPQDDHGLHPGGAHAVEQPAQLAAGQITVRAPHVGPPCSSNMRRIQYRLPMRAMKSSMTWLVFVLRRRSPPHPKYFRMSLVGPAAE